MISGQRCCGGYDGDVGGDAVDDGGGGGNLRKTGSDLHGCSHNPCFAALVSPAHFAPSAPYVRHQPWAVMLYAQFAARACACAHTYTHVYTHAATSMHAGAPSVLGSGGDHGGPGARAPTPVAHGSNNDMDANFGGPASPRNKSPSRPGSPPMLLHKRPPFYPPGTLCRPVCLARTSLAQTLHDSP
eukprot:1159185-Pelagomonas_calceolata.AAC.5